MGMVHTLGAVTVVPGTPTPVLFAAANSPFTTYAIASVAFANDVLTVTLTDALPALGLGLNSNGFNGPNGPNEQNGTTGSTFDNTGGVAPGNGVGGGQQVILWGFSTYLDLNGTPITVISNDGVKSFSFRYNNPNDYSGSDTGSCAPRPFQHYRAIRLEAGQGNSTDYVYVGDKYVSDSQYMAALSLAGQLAVEISSDNCPADLICIDGTTDTDTVQLSLVY